LFGTALFVAVFGPKGDSTEARSAITRPALVKIVSSEERPANLDVDPSSAAIPTSATWEPALADVAAPTSNESPATAPVSTSRRALSQSFEANPVRVASAPPEGAAPSAGLASEATPLDVRPRLVGAAPKAEVKVVAGTQPRTPNVNRTAKLSTTPPVSVTVAKTTATTPSAWAEIPRQPQHTGASTMPQAPTEPQTIAPAPAAPQEPVNPITFVLGARIRVLGPSAVDQSAGKSGDWAIQFAEPKSEVEAEAAAARLNAKYAPALNGAMIGIRKTQVNGETIYALRVAGLSKADAMALCLRVKGRDCSLIK
jgi:hypothetical protein